MSRESIQEDLQRVQSIHGDYMFYGLANLNKNHWRTFNYDLGRLLIRDNDDNYNFRSNVCPHQGSLIKAACEGRGLASVCPYHGWSWDENGQPKGQGTVGHTNRSSKCKNDKPLVTSNAYLWNNFIFGKYISFKQYDISGNYHLEEQRVDHIKANIVPIMDLFLDIDHIPVVHPGVYDKIDIPKVDEVRWETGWGQSLQVVKTNEDKVGALWLAVYPGVMFEWQPGAVFVMVNKPINDNETLSYVFKYKDTNYDEVTWKLNNEVWEEAWQQDKQQAEALEPFWRTIPNENLDDEKRNFRFFINNPFNNR